jgi:hypothetical protein
LTSSSSLGNYGTRVRATLGSEIGLVWNKDLTVPLKDGRTASLHADELRVINADECAARLTFYSECYATAAVAEQVGVMLSVGLVWAAISKKFSLQLDYETALPAEVYNLSGSLTFGVKASGLTYWRLEDHKFQSLVRPVLDTWTGLPDNVRLSMELFVAAPFEATSRARFVSIVSALEPLARPIGYDAATQKLVDDYVALLDIRPEVPEHARRSLRGRLKYFRAESISQSLKRLTSELLPGDHDAAEVVDEAYGIRSNILHEGQAYADLDHRIPKIAGVLRRLYAATTGWPLVTP